LSQHEPSQRGQLIHHRFFAVKNILLLLGLTFATTAFGFLFQTVGPDAFNYNGFHTDLPITYETIAGVPGSVRLTTAGTDYDDQNFTADLGFSFNFYGVAYTQVSVGVNGLLTFGGTNFNFANSALANPAVDKPAIAVFWDDLYIKAGQANAIYVLQRVNDFSGQQECVIEWYQVHSVNDSTGNDMTFQIILRADGTMKCLYPDVTGLAGISGGASATLGIRDTGAQTNGRVMQMAFNTAYLSDADHIDYGPAGVLSFDSATFTEKEENGFVFIKVVRSGGSTGELQGHVKATDGSATAPADYTATDGNVTLAGTNLSFPIAIVDGDGSEPNETFGITLSSANGSHVGGLTTAVAKILAKDSVKPSLTVASPALLQVFSEGTTSTTVSGSVSDNKEVASVEASQPDGSFVPLTVQGSGADMTYSGDVNLKPGPQVITVRATDTRGNVRSVFRPVTRTFLRPLTVAITPAGSGTVTPPFPGTVPGFQVGNEYTVKATPKAGFIFRDWTGTGPGIDLTDPSPILFFTMSEGFTLTATFVPDPRLALGGAYSGTIRTVFPSPVSVASEGQLTLKVLPTGAFTGKLWIDGARIPVVGRFDEKGKAVFGATGEKVLTIPRRGAAAYLLSLSLDLAFNTQTIAGTLSREGTSISSDVLLDRSLYTAAKATTAPYSNPDPALLGLLTAALGSVPPAQQLGGLDVSLYPQAPGWATGSVAKNGTFKVIGKLPDGTPLTLSAPLSKDNVASVFASLYGGKGYVVGDIVHVTSNADADYLGTSLLWVKPAVPTAKAYPAGWPGGIFLGFTGQKYDPTAALYPGLAPVDAALGNLSLFTNDGDDLITGPLGLNLARGTLTRTSGITFPCGGKITPADGRVKLTHYPARRSPPHQPHGSLSAEERQRRRLFPRPQP
jgi:hypothetical protein